jgi:hypothetical protein
MVMRTVVGLSWSFVSGLAGVWLLMSPWTLGEQSSGDWTTVTRVQFGTGLGLAVLGAIGTVMVAAQVVSALRGSGMLRRPVRTPTASTTSGQEMEQVLISLANALAADLDRQHGLQPTQVGRSQPAEDPGTSTSASGPTTRSDAGWRSER